MPLLYANSEARAEIIKNYPACFSNSNSTTSSCRINYTIDTVYFAMYSLSTFLENHQDSGLAAPSILPTVDLEKLQYVAIDGTEVLELFDCLELQLLKSVKEISIIPTLPFQKTHRDGEAPSDLVLVEMEHEHTDLDFHWKSVLKVFKRHLKRVSVKHPEWKMPEVKLKRHVRRPWGYEHREKFKFVVPRVSAV